MARKNDLLHCEVCRSEVKETKLGRTGDGPLTQLRCPKCRVLFYIERAVWRRATKGTPLKAAP